MVDLLSVFLLCISLPLFIQKAPADWRSSTNLSSIGWEFSPLNQQALLLLTTNRNSLLSCTQQFPPVQNVVLIGGSGNGSLGRDLYDLNGSLGMSMDVNGSIYVADLNNARVIKLHEGSLLETIVAGTGISGLCNNQWNHPAGTYVDKSLNLYVTDSFNSRVMLWLNNSTSATRVAPIAVDSQGNMYLSDYPNHRIQRWILGASNGTTIIGTTGIYGTDSTLLNNPSDVLLNPDETYIYVSEMGNNRIQRFTLV